MHHCFFIKQNNQQLFLSNKQSLDFYQTKQSYKTPIDQNPYITNIFTWTRLVCWNEVPVYI